MHQILPTTQAHVDSVLACLRGVDLSSFEIAGIDTKAVTDNIVAQSVDVCSATLDNELACIFGIIPVHVVPAIGFLWMMTTPKVEAQPFVFLRHSQLVLDQLMKKYERLETLVDASMDRSLNYIEWLKFKRINSQFANGKTFILFMRER